MRPITVALLFALFAITCLAGTSIYVDHIEQEISSKLAAAAKRQQPDVPVTVTLPDTTSNASAAPAGQHLRADGASATANRQHAAPTPFRFNAVFKGGELTMTGAVDSAETIALLGQTGTSLGPTVRVHQQFASGAQALPADSAVLRAGIKLLSHLIEGSLDVDAEHWRLQGLAADPATRRQIEAAIESLRESIEPLTLVTDLDIHSLISAECKRYLHRDSSGTRIKFSSGSVQVKPQYIAQLRRFAALPEKCAGRLLIEAHSDNRGDEQYNKRLSKQRAATVKQYLVKLGADPRSIHSFAYGEMRAAASNESGSGQSANRRVDLHFIQSLTAVPVLHKSPITISLQSAE